MEQYQTLVKNVVENGSYQENRTDTDTIATFNENYEIDLSKGFPLVTTKNMSDYRWNSMIHELLWYFSGQHHIRELRKETKIWDAWADEDWNLPSAYGRFWRRFPVPQANARLEGETWIDEDSPWVSKENGTLVFDQLQYVVDTLKGENPNRGPYSRRLVVLAWHPSNACVSDLPPCHYTYVFTVIGDRLNLHVTQRSGDVALGIPFNIAAYSLLLKTIAKQTEFKVGKFAHTIVNAHIYCGKGNRGKWYDDNLGTVREMIKEKGYNETANYIDENGPDEQHPDYDHIPNLLIQLGREPLGRSKVEISDEEIDKLSYSDFQLSNYKSHGPLNFEVAE